MIPDNRPFFSAIIPVCNGEKYLAAAIETVLHLSYEPMELIIVDDGSTDGTEKIIANYSSRIRYVCQPNRGPASARNRGLQYARGNIIGFLDADDLWTPAIVTQALASLTSNPDVDIVQGRIQEITPRPYDVAGIAYDYLSAPYPFINLGSAVYRKDVFAKIGGFDETMRFCEDYDWFLRAFDARIYKVRIDEVTLLYRTHSGGMTWGKSLHEIGMAKAHKKAIERRRQGHLNTGFSKNFPTLAEYMGFRPAAHHKESCHKMDVVPRP